METLSIKLAAMCKETEEIPVVSRDEQVYERTAVPISREKSAEIN
jgi:hypothetical protein